MKNIYVPLLWYPISGYEGYYEINKLGTVRSVDRHVPTKKSTNHYKRKYLKSRISYDGYIEYRLCMYGVQRVFGQHRLLALTFIPKPRDKNEVNHINGIKTDNSIENLEWVTHRENIAHGYSAGLFKIPNTTKRVVDTCTGKVFPSARKAASFFSIPYSSLKNYLNGNRKKNPTCLQYDSRN